MNHQISENEFFDVIDEHVDCQGAFSSNNMLKTLDTAGYAIVKKIPKHAQSTDGYRVYSPMEADENNTIVLAGKEIASYEKYADPKHGLVKVTLLFTDGTKLAITSHPTRTEVGSKVDVVLVEPLKTA